MATPLTTLRKYQFGFFVFFGVLLMVVFVVGDPLYSWLGDGGGRGNRQEDITVVTWRGGSLKESEIQYQRGVRNVVREFVRALLEETQKRNGAPRVQQLSLSDSEQEIAYTHIFADKAHQMGMSVTDETVLQYLEKLSADLIPRNEIGRIFTESIAGRITEQQALNVIKTELAAQNYISLAYPDISRGQLPADAWEYYRRLNRRVKAELLPLEVAAFKSKVAKEPTEAEIEELYTKGKERYSDPASPEPGFKRRRKAAFAYVKADRKKFEDEALPKLRSEITEQEITDYYSKNKEEFRVTEPPAAPAKPEKPEAEAKPVDDAAKPEGEPANSANAPASPNAEGDAKPAADSKPAAESNPPANPPSESETSKDQPAVPPASPPAADPQPTPEPDKNPPAASEDSPPSDKSATDSETPPANPDGGCQDEAAPAENEPTGKSDEEKGDEKPATQNPADATQPPTSETPAADKPASDAPAAAPPATEGTQKDAAKPDQPASADQPAPDQPATDPAAPPTKPAANAPPEKPSAANPPAEKPPTTYRQLDEKLREEIRERIAGQKATRAAQDRVDTALNEIRRMVARHSQQLRNSELKGKAKPEPLNLEKVAQERGLTAGQVPLSDPLEVDEYELGKTFGFDFSSMSFERISFANLAYREGIPLYKPEEIRGENFDVHFLYWKTEDVEPFVPELKEIREEVVDAWKQAEAFKIAQAEAKQMADQARQAKKPLKEVFGENDDRKVIETNEFSWMTMGAVPGGMGRPALSSVDGVEYAGEDFMGAVTSLDVGEVGVAANQPHTVVYVARLVSESPSNDALRDMFLQAGFSMEMQFVARMDRQESHNQWLQAVERDMAVKWERDPQS